ncbi:MAG: type III pantothenate kinase [Phycisphaeraceae bacterium]|nr:type III pantothenate kinase [Phycisphaeraceae bacterium]
MHEPGLSSELPILALAVGNTRTRWATFRGRELLRSHAEVNADPAALAERIASDAEGAEVVAVASVNEPFAAPLADALRGRLGVRVERVGQELPLDLTHSLDDASTLGQDRALNAIGAFARARQACAIVDAGTAVTVDFIDGDGVFHGGAIAPGLNAMLDAMHRTTAALPALRHEPPDPARGTIGKDTRHAMILGVRAAAQGMVRLLVERYAEVYGAYPQVIATGGDAATLFEGDGLVDDIVPDLQLIGIQAAVEAAMAAGDAGDA